MKLRGTLLHRSRCQELKIATLHNIAFVNILSASFVIPTVLSSYESSYGCYLGLPKVEDAKLYDISNVTTKQNYVDMADEAV